ncbi:hypothetical protein QYF61_018666, partial [Mycteria americana]
MGQKGKKKITMRIAKLWKRFPREAVQCHSSYQEPTLAWALHRLQQLPSGHLHLVRKRRKRKEEGEREK